MPRPHATSTIQEYDTDGSESACTPPSSVEQIQNTATVHRNAKAVDIPKLRQLMLNKKSAKESGMAARKETADRASELQKLGNTTGEASDSREIYISELRQRRVRANERFGEVINLVFDYEHDTDLLRLRNSHKVQIPQH
jgi:hypothetical protein